MRRYQVFFRFASGVLIGRYDQEGVTIEAHDAKDALIQAAVEIDEINRRHNMIAGDRWSYRNIVALPDDPTGVIEAEREACAKIADKEAESVVDDKAFSSADTIAREIRARSDRKERP